MTSSNTSSAPYRVHNSRNRATKGTLARTKFILPAMLLITTQAISLPARPKASSS
jgi:hypothetical protein